MVPTAEAGGAVVCQVGFSGQLHPPWNRKREFSHLHVETARLRCVGSGVEGRGAPRPLGGPPSLGAGLSWGAVPTKASPDQSLHPAGLSPLRPVQHQSHQLGASSWGGPAPSPLRGAWSWLGPGWGS